MNPKGKSLVESDPVGEEVTYIEAFKHVNKVMIGQSIDFSNLHRVDNESPQQVEDAINDLKVKMVEASAKVWIEDKKKAAKCKIESNYFTDQRNAKLFEEYAGRVDLLMDLKMQEVLKN